MFDNSEKQVISRNQDKCCRILHWKKYGARSGKLHLWWAKWAPFFYSLFDLEYLSLDRSLPPPNSIGQPWLLIFSDGSDLTNGFVAFIRWQLNNGDYWCPLVIAKCRIAPVNKLSTPPPMELNAVVLSKRGRKVIEKDMRFNFERSVAHCRLRDYIGHDQQDQHSF